MTFPFARTTCACAACVACCTRQPGSLVPGDLDRIAAHLRISLVEATAFVWASPGARVMDTTTGRQFRVGTITPRVARGRCVFLDDEDRCRVHAVAPAGCAHFDTHMSAREAQPRSAAMVRLQQDPDYQRLRGALPFATSYKPRAY